MSSAYTKKLIISSIALSLALGGGSLYAVKRSALAQASGAQASSANHQSDSGQILHKTQKRGSHAGKRFPLLEEAASILGMNQQALEKSLQEGRSIVDVAKDKGISEADLTSKLLNLRNTKIEDAVKSGKLDAAKAGTMKQRMEEHLKFMLNEKGLPARHEHHFKGAYQGLDPDFQKIAESLGMTKEELKNAQRSGKSLTEIAAAKGMSKDKLMEIIKTQLTPSIEQMVDRKKPVKN
jgi:hypothetical protein